MGAIRSVARTAVGRWTRFTAKRRIGELRTAGGAEGARLANALERALAGPGSGPSAAWFSRIEALRSRLKGDHTALSITDYGAGSTGDNRSVAEMEQGVQVHKSVSDMCGASKAPFWASILHEVVREYRPETGLELGTCLGLSAAYQASAMELNDSGRFLTLEGAESLADVSAGNLDELGLSDRVSIVRGRFSDTLDSAIAQLEPIEYAFIDGHHDEHATIDYFEQLLPHLAERSVLVFDDTSWTEGMKRAWQTIISHDAVTLSADLGAFGICVLDPSIAKPANVKISFRGL